MATPHFERTTHKHGNKKSAMQKVQYISREGAYSPRDVPTQARVDHLDLQPGGERLRDDLIHKEVHNLPSWAHDNAVTFFAAAEEYERGRNAGKWGGVIMTEWKFSLPRELTSDQQLTAARDFLHSQLGETHPYVFAMHEPRAADGGTNPHIHCLWSSRTLDGIERPVEQFFRRYNAVHPERGGARKDPALTKYGEMTRERQAYTDVINLHLDRAGSLERLHPGSHRSRGLERDPESRVFPSDSNRAKFHQEITDNWAEVLANRARRPTYAAAEATDAQQYWKQRKMQLGITRHVSHELAMERIADARTRSLTTPPHQRSPRALQHEAQAITQSIKSVEHYHATIHRELAAEQHYARLAKDRPHAGQREAERVLAAGRQHGLAPDLDAERLVASWAPARSHGHAVKVRVFDRTREREGPGYDRE